MIKMVNVSKSYISKKKSVNVLENINCELPNAGLVFITGPSGSGKTTLLNMLGCLDIPSSGNIFVDDRCLNQLNLNEQDKYRNYDIGFVFQDWCLLSNLNVYDNVLLALNLQNEKDNDKVLRVLEKLNIKNLAKRKVNQLSGGEQARVGLARALVKNPKIILCDEPTGNLDYKTSIEVFSWLKEISKDKLVIVASHDEVAANKYGDIILKISNGNLEQQLLNTLVGNNANVSTKKGKISFINRFKLAISFIKTNKVFYLCTSLILIVCCLIFNVSISLANIDLKKVYFDALEVNNVKDIKLVDGYKVDETFFIKTLFGNRLNNLKSYLDSKQYSYQLSDEIYTIKDWNNFTLFLYPNENRYSVLWEYVDEDGVDNFEVKRVKNDYFDNKKFVGQFPKNKNEIVITDVLAYCIRMLGVKTSDKKVYKPKTNEELVNSGEWIDFEGTYLKITGILNTREIDFEKFEKKKIEFEEVCDKYECRNVPIIDDEIKLFERLMRDVYVSEYFYDISDFPPNSFIYGPFEVFYAQENKFKKELNAKIDLKNILKEDEIIIGERFLTNELRERFEEERNNDNFNEIEFLKENGLYGRKVKLMIKDSENILGNKDLYNYELKIIGIDSNYTILPATIFKKFVTPNVQYKSIKLPYTKEIAQDLVSKYDYSLKKDGINVIADFSYELYENDTNIKSFMHTGKSILGIISVVILLFISILALFIIRINRKNIGILKCLGLGNRDIHQIFVLNLLVVLVFVVLFSIPLGTYTLKIVNGVLLRNMVYKYTFVWSSIINYVLLFIVLGISSLVSLWALKGVKRLHPVDVLRGNYDKVKKRK